MRADLALKEKFNISRSKARELIEEGNVLFSDKRVDKPSMDIPEEKLELLKLLDSPILKYVGRGALKLEKALSLFKINPEGLICLDIGASTGGFTDVLVQNNARLVYAVDVGSAQLAQRLREDSRVVSVENTDIRDFNVDPVDFICTDVSFISLTKILPEAKELLKEGGEAVVLIKPQFEAGREHLNKGGIVKDKRVHKRVIEGIIAFCDSLGLYTAGLTVSPIKGGDGNTEYLLYLTKNIDKKATVDVKAVLTSEEADR